MHLAIYTNATMFVSKQLHTYKSPTFVNRSLAQAAIDEVMLSGHAQLSANDIHPDDYLMAECTHHGQVVQSIEFNF